ncbi:hypothetical protein [Ralstonia solanacearum]|uniref:DNA (cytosine-5-)-methyltransferase n=1 Tax=Ralstonia solanacearum TaxID=305 RepID=A0AAE3T689_RALSL|nr:hypothetical protein [Ralstonia solanacearum]MDB0524964.1 hypothetical protein [Ralstonia solanacearum]
MALLAGWATPTANTNEGSIEGKEARREALKAKWAGKTGNGMSLLSVDVRASVSQSIPGPTNGLWRAADWLLCRDGRWRPVEPGSFPLADGAASRVGRLRAYGNAVNAEAARVFIEHVMEWL